MTSTQTLTTSHQQLYETDFVEWVDRAAELLKQGRLSELDIENLIEEVESLGKRDRRAIQSNLVVLLMHLLKWEFQPEHRSNSWRGSIREHRRRISLILEDSPSLKNYLSQKYEDCYEEARLQAADETGLPLNTFPEECPYPTDQVMSTDFLPE